MNTEDDFKNDGLKPREAKTAYVIASNAKGGNYRLEGERRAALYDALEARRRVSPWRVLLPVLAGVAGLSACVALVVVSLPRTSPPTEHATTEPFETSTPRPAAPLPATGMAWNPEDDVFDTRLKQTRERLSRVFQHEETNRWSLSGDSAERLRERLRKLQQDIANS